jgi:hypothetical protein
MDRFLVAEELIEVDPNMESLILPKEGLDHWSVAFHLETSAMPKYKPFGFEEFLLSHPDFHHLAKS